MRTMRNLGCHLAVLYYLLTVYDMEGTNKSK